MSFSDLVALRKYINLKGIGFLISSIIRDLFSVFLFIFLGFAINSLVISNSSDFLLYLLIVFVFTLLLLITNLLSIYLKSKYRVSLSILLRERVTFLLTSSENPYKIELGGSGAYLPWFLDEVERMNSVIFAIISILSSSIRIFILFFTFGISSLYLLALVILFLLLYFLIPLKTRGFNEKLGREYQQFERGEYFKSLDTFKSISVFFRNQKGESFLGRLLGISRSFSIKKIRIIVKQQIVSNLIELFFSTLLLLLELINGIFVYYNLLPFSSFVIATAFFGQAVGALKDIKDSRLRIQRDSFLFKRFDNTVVAEVEKPLTDFETLQINSLNFESGGKQIIRNFDLVLNKGDKIAVIGESGSGKTTLARIISGLVGSFKGEIIWGKHRFKDTRLKGAASSIFLLNSEPQIFEATLRDNLTLFSTSFSISKISDLLNYFGLDNLDLDSRIDIKKISKGEAQRIALLRALLVEKEILILDESLSGVDKFFREKIESWLLSKPGLTLINITHSLSMQQRYSKVINLGRQDERL